MAWEIEFTDDFGTWWDSLSEDEQITIRAKVVLLEKHGPTLSRPHADVIHGSRYQNLKELRAQHNGRPYRVLFIFDPKRTGVLLIGGDKTGDNRWYEEYVPRAEKIYASYLAETGQSGETVIPHGIKSS
jgi:hypothetical protein